MEGYACALYTDIISLSMSFNTEVASQVFTVAAYMYITVIVLPLLLCQSMCLVFLAAKMFFLFARFLHANVMFYEYTA